jgi:hypothetical protein
MRPPAGPLLPGADEEVRGPFAQKYYEFAHPYDDWPSDDTFGGFTGMRPTGKEGTGKEEATDWEALLMEMLGELGLAGGGDDSLGWAQLDQRRQEFAQQLAFEAEQAALNRAQQQREMAAALGQAITNLQSQQWAEGLPWVLPDDTTFVPGYEPGGPVSTLARMGGANYTPPRAQQAPPPSREEMESWLQSALAQFGP